MELQDSLWVVVDLTTHLLWTVLGEALVFVESVNVRQEKTLKR
jgi:hypothetical protein